MSKSVLLTWSIGQSIDRLIASARYNIRRREAEWRARQDEQISQRHIAWEMDQLAQKRRIAQVTAAPHAEPIRDPGCDGVLYQSRVR